MQCFDSASLPSFVSHFNGARWINIFSPAPLIILELSALCQQEKWLLRFSAQQRASAVSPRCHKRALACRWGDVELVEMSRVFPHWHQYLHSFSPYFICRGSSLKFTCDIPHWQLSKICLRTPRKDSDQSLPPFPSFDSDSTSTQVSIVKDKLSVGKYASSCPSISESYGANGGSFVPLICLENEWGGCNEVSSLGRVAVD